MTEKKQFWGYFVVGFLSLAGGIAIFLKVVPARVMGVDVPRDVQMVFTQIYAQEQLHRNEKGRFTEDLKLLGAEESCQRFQCAIQVSADGNNYSLVLRKDGRMWVQDRHSPKPREITVGK